MVQIELDANGLAALLAPKLGIPPDVVLKALKEILTDAGTEAILLM